MPTTSKVQCGSCKTDNAQEAKFCAGCGQSLYENCGECGKSVLLTQKFCGDCGADLEKTLQQRRSRHQQWMKEALSLAKSHDYDRAIDVLGRITELGDYRFQEAIDDATVASNKIRLLRERATENLESARTDAIEAAKDGDQLRVLKSLERIPERLLDDEGKRMLDRAKAFNREWTALEQEVRAAIAEKSWALVGTLTGQLLELNPDHAQYRKLAGQVAGKLVNESNRLRNHGQYEMSVASLDAIPEFALTEEIRELRNSAFDVHWLSEQFDAELYATPTLGRLAVRLSKETPNDPRTQKLVKQLSSQLKQAARPERSHLPRWKGNASSWLGGEAGLLSLPVNIKYDGVTEFRAAAGRMNVAIGLAIQGVGRGRVSDDFSLKKKSRLSFGKRKVIEAWGVDVGNASLKAVLLRDDGGELRIVDAFVQEFETPLCRRCSDLSEHSIVLPAIEKFITEKQPDRVPIWVNLPSSATVNRFVKLPPVKDKESLNLLNQEVETRIPIPLDELVVVRWIHALDRESSLGRPAAACAARKNLVAQRIDLLESCGLKIDGMQCDSIALVNFAAHEFASLWPTEATDDVDSHVDAMSRAVVLLDCGASSCNILLVSGEAHWCWSIETGGEDLTNQIARAAKATHAEAEKLKRNPAAMTSPASDYERLEQRLDEIRARLSNFVADANKQGNKFQPKQTWCMGGGCLTHQWIRRVVLDSPLSK